MVRTPALAAEATLQPIRRFDFDAAIIFSDIMTPLEALGIEIEFAPDRCIARPLRSSAQTSRRSASTEQSRRRTSAKRCG